VADKTASFVVGELATTIFAYLATKSVDEKVLNLVDNSVDCLE
jgi:hypothetical protein